MMMRTQFLMLVGLFAIQSVAGQQMPSASVRVSDALSLTKDSAWSNREAGLNAVAALLDSGKETPADADRLRLGLVQQLERENIVRQNPATTIPNDEREYYSNYFADLIGTVADLNDARAIPSLLAVASSGRMATSGIARFGKIALDPVLRQVASQNPALAEGALFVLVDMLEYHTVNDADSLLRIKSALRTALAHPDGIVRVSAIYAIEYLKDREEFVPILTDIANRDPFNLEGQVAADGQDNGEVFPVRRAARSLLARIAKREPPRVQP